MQGVPQVECKLSGFAGWARHLDTPYTRLNIYISCNNLKLGNFSDMQGDAYWESVNCSANVAHMTFSGPFFRAIWGKLGFVCLAGPPNIGKTKEIRSALHFSSSDQYFFAMKVLSALCPEFN